MTKNIRKCIGCSEKYDRNTMFRITKKFDNNEIIIEPTNKDFGRSVYICKNLNCINNAFKKDKISRILKVKSLSTIKEQLIEKIQK